MNELRIVVREDDRWLEFDHPQTVLLCRVATDLPRLLQRLDAALASGRFVAGMLAYEAAAGLGLPVRAPEPEGPPLAVFGVFGAPAEIDAPRPDASEVPARDWRPAIGPRDYNRAVAAIQEHIAAGDTYQVNFTFPLEASFEGDPWRLFARLVATQRGLHSAFVDLGRHVVVSASPERFFALDGTTAVTRPMKGTAARGLTPEADDRAAAALAASPKDRAENVMIVDMLRNDLGRVAAFGSVNVPALFEVERYPTLLQMVSSVSARSDAPLSAILAALFPCASVTGAPKRRTMEIIAALEPSARGVYTGAVGWAGPGRKARFNVAIRTAMVDRERRRATFGVGSGIVADSSAEAEYAECRLKARILDEPAFSLIETMRFQPGSAPLLLEGHLARLVLAARHFAIPLDLARLRADILAAARRLSAVAKIRLTVDWDGRASIETAPAPPSDDHPVRAGLARRPIRSDDPWLRFKTTRRRAYDEAKASRPDCDDVLLWNERGELTEGTIANLVVETADGLVTPTLECGLLPGVLRASLLAEARVREGVIPASSLAARPRLWLVSALRGWRDVALID